MAFVKLANICKEYKISKVQEQKVLRGINVEFKRGELVAILGESGCGKSTLINIMGGLDMEYTGSIELQGEFIRDYTEKQMDDYRKKKVGLIFQNYNLIPHMTLLENVEIAMTMSNAQKDERKERAIDLLKLVGMEEYYNKMPSQLSGGQKQRVAIARALANNPSILLADEPTGALDKDSADIVLQILKKIADRGKLVIIVTHSQKIASSCSRIIEIDDGIIIQDKKNYEYHADTNLVKTKDKEIKTHNISLSEVFKLSFNNLVQSKSRSILVAIGMSIGITAVILILCLSSGMTNYVNAMLSSENASSMVMMVEKANSRTITDNEIEYITGFEGIGDIYESHLINNGVTYIYGDGTSTPFNKIYTCYEICTPEILYGTLPSTGGVILNTEMATTLTDDDISTLIGTEISLTYKGNLYDFEIVGIYTEPNDVSTLNAFLSVTDMTTILGEDADVNFLYITASDATYITALTEDITALGYTVTQIDVSASELLDYIDIATGVLTGVGAISMVVSAIMIFIVLYISVIERTKEIGIIRAIGGRKKDIQLIFNFEALMLGTMGGLIGCIISLLVSGITNIITNASIGYSLISYNVLYYLVGLLSCVIISSLSSIAPSIYAANMDPVEALRNE